VRPIRLFSSSAAVWNRFGSFVGALIRLAGSSRKPI
ncbi:uncharacterized protein METZ01_LOCUS146937, partial [marine metagenome]